MAGIGGFWPQSGLLITWSTTCVIFTLVYVSLQIWLKLRFSTIIWNVDNPIYLMRAVHWLAAEIIWFCAALAESWQEYYFLCDQEVLRPWLRVAKWLRGANWNICHTWSTLALVSVMEKSAIAEWQWNMPLIRSQEFSRLAWQYNAWIMCIMICVLLCFVVVCYWSISP